MSIQPRPRRSESRRPAPAPSTVDPFAPTQWRLLVRLPGRVAATAAGLAAARLSAGTANHGLAALEAIAAGRRSSSALVRRVVAAIYAESEARAESSVRVSDGAPAEAAGWSAADPGPGLTGVLAECRSAARLLTDRAGTADAVAYRDWLLRIAAAGAGPREGDHDEPDARFRHLPLDPAAGTAGRLVTELRRALR